MSVTNFPNGISSFGVPVLGGQLPSTTGKYIFVDSVSGSDGNSGLTSAQPKATVVGALVPARANKGDIIVLMPKHAETVAAADLAFDIAGVEIVGLGIGLDRPTFTFSAAGSTINVSAASMKISNCHFIANYLDVASAFTLAAAKDFVVSNCTFDDNTLSLNFLSIVTTSAVDQAAEGLQVLGCTWNGLNTTPLAFVSILAANDRIKLNDNNVFKDATNSVGHFVTLAAKVVLEFECRRNVLAIVGDASGGVVGIFLTGSSTTNKGVVADNYVSGLDTTGEILFTVGTKLAFFNNLYTGVADKSGYILPAIDAA